MKGVTILVWRSTWDTEDDAKEFTDAYASAVSARYGERAHADSTDENKRVFIIPAAPAEERTIRTTREERVVVERRGKDVLVVEGTTPAETGPLVDEMWTELVRGAPPPVDEAKLAAKAKTLEEHIGSAEKAPERPDLMGRMFLPARTMAIRLGTGVGIDEQPRNGLSPIFALNDTEMRWGFRPNLELSLPLALRGEITSFAGATIAGVGLKSIISPTFSVELTQALPIGNTIVVVGQGIVDDVGAGQSTRLAAGALLRPFPALVVSPSVARVDSPDGGHVVVGSAMRRGSSPAPLVELEVIDGLFVYEASNAFLDVKPKGLALRAQTHVLGLLLYF